MNRMFTETAINPEFVVIQYPGIVKNVERALTTLGGINTISQNHQAGRPLELRPTPENPYTSSLSSDKKVEAKVTSGTIHIVVKIRRKKKTPAVMDARCLGLVHSIYTFDSICDFQYLPIKGRPGEEVFDDLIPRLIPQNLGHALCWWQRPDTPDMPTPLFLPPFQFSRYNTPSQKILCRETDFSIDKTKRKTGHGQNLRVERRALSITVHATDPFPNEPSPEAIADANLRCKNEEPHRLLHELFESRPMWTRVACVYKTGLDDNLLKALLQKFAFYISSGPWGRLWCRFGYDPRKNLEARQYQTLVVSFRLHSKIPERQRLKVSTDRTHAPVPGELSEPIHYAYIPGRLPRVRQMWYSLCDIELPEALDVMNRGHKDTVDEEFGWMTKKTMELIRKLVKDDVEKTSVEMDVDSVDTMIDEDDWR